MSEGTRPYRYPVSIKGVVQSEKRYLLLKNERSEWELPGGKLELKETPEACLAREIEEETGIRVKVGPILDSWTYYVFENVYVFIVTYGCHSKSFADITYSSEHKDVGLFNLQEVESLKMPEGYKKSIRLWSRLVED